MIDYNHLCREPSKAAQRLPLELVPSIQARVSAALLTLSARLQWEQRVTRAQAHHDDAVSGTDRFVGKAAALMLGVTANWLHSNAWRLPFAVRLGSYGDYAPLRFSVETIDGWRQYLRQERESGGRTLRTVVRTKDFGLLNREEQAQIQS